MPLLTERDITKLATAASVDLVENKIPLNTTISKLAASMDLTQEQIKRVCESANNTTFNTLFKSKDKTASDRMIEFKVADANEILSSQIKAASVDAELPVALRELRELPDLVNIDETPAYEKVASVDEDLREKRASARAQEQDRRTVSKTLDYLRHTKIAKLDAYRDCLSGMVTEFKRLYNREEFSDFEKKAMALHGKRGADVLNDIRELRSQPRINYNYEAFEKSASVIDDAHVVYIKLAAALKLHDELLQIDKAVTKLEGVQ